MFNLVEKYKHIFHPLISLNKRLPIKHLSVVGSAAHKNFNELDEIDIYIVLSKFGKIEFDLILSKIHYILINSSPDFEWLIEARRGPFKKKLGDKEKQIHILIDDIDSIKLTSYSTLFNWDRNGIKLFGDDIFELINFDYEMNYDLVVKSINADLSQMQDNLLSRQISYKEWNFNGLAKLEDKKKIDIDDFELANCEKHFMQTRKQLIPLIKEYGLNKKVKKDYSYA